ncbi:3-oxoacyl-[acyl-carrier-protein] synthase 2 [Planctomycetales bacterium]|nr:3-oxoacyl-[acyl-carrier-protein] synthase 2 [Planctomycetales bacterium]
MQRVVITGYGLVTPLGCNTEEVWNKVCSGKSGIVPFVLSGFETIASRIAGLCSGFSLDGYISPHETRRLEPFVQYAMRAAIDAVRQSGLDFQNENTDRCAAIIGSGVGGLSEIEYQHKRLLEKGPSKVMPLTIPKIMPNAAAGNVSIYYGLTGPSYAVSSACASATNAIADACMLIRYGLADVVITGGSEAAATAVGMAGFSAMHALSTRNSEPEKASRPFDKDRDGFVLSDGCGILVLESQEHAKKRSANVFGELLGAGITSDGTHITQPDKDGTGAAKAIIKALADAKIEAEDIDYINAHGTGTQLGDAAETNAICRAFGEASKSVAISSTKSQIGHLLGGSGAVEAIFSLLALRDGIIPPTINLETPDPECNLDYTPNTARERKIGTVLSNSFGFGGHNGCLIISKQH